LSRYLDQETAKGPFRSSSQAATVTTSVTRGNPVKCLTQGHLTLFNAERQAGKLRIPTFKVFWSF